jgi:transketolase
MRNKDKKMSLQKMMSTRDAFGEELVELGRKHKEVVVLDADLSKATRTCWFAKEFPDRFFDMGISEQDMLGTAAGLSLCGKIPIASTFTIFATTKAFDQIRNTIAYPELNVKIVVTHGGITIGADGASHQSIEHIALMRAIPNMTIIVPADGVETKGALKYAIEIKGPVFIVVGRDPTPVIFSDDHQFDFRHGEVLKEGKDVAIIAAGIMVEKALRAGEKLAERGISSCIVDMHTIKPIDRELIIEVACKTGGIVTAEEHTIIGGLGSAVAEVISENSPVPLKRIGLRDRFGQSGSAEELLKEYHLTEEDIIKAAEELMRGN